jgi:CSLREA domain-containing protein
MTRKARRGRAVRVATATVAAPVVALLSTAIAVLPASAALAAPGHTFVVNSTGDAGAAGSTADGVCDTGATVGGQPECTLRAAIEEANGTTGADAIDATGVSGTIQLGGRLQITADLEITGPGADELIVNGGGDAGGFQVFFISHGDAVGISGLTISGGTLTSSPAGVDGGGIMSYASLLTLDAVAVTGNHLDTGGIAGGGGVASAGDLVIVDSTIADNRASGSFTFGQAGGVDVVNDGSLTITNSTIAGNQVSAGSSGGGIRSGGSVALDSVTFADNTATSSFGIPANDVWVQDVVTARNTIFGSTGGIDCKVVPGPLTSLGHNLEAGAGGSCGLTDSTDLDGVDPQLGALGDNGGPTPTLALASLSPAVDAGATGQTVDQRGVARPQGAAADIGAFELVADTTPPDTTIVSGPPGAIASGDVSFAFVADEPGSTFVCELDGPGAAVGAPIACDSAQAYTGLADGEYTFSVYAIDGAGNADPVPASRTFTVSTASAGGTGDGDADGGGTDGGGGGPGTGALASTGIPVAPVTALLLAMLLGSAGLLLLDRAGRRGTRRADHGR